MSVTNRPQQMRPFARPQEAPGKPAEHSATGLIALAFGAMVVISAIDLLINGVN